MSCDRRNRAAPARRSRLPAARRSNAPVTPRIRIGAAVILCCKPRRQTASRASFGNRAPSSISHFQRTSIVELEKSSTSRAESFERHEAREIHHVVQHAWLHPQPDRPDRHFRRGSGAHRKSRCAEKARRTSLDPSERCLGPERNSNIAHAQPADARSHPVPDSADSRRRSGRTALRSGPMNMKSFGIYGEGAVTR
jgi:hypothetical protein